MARKRTDGDSIADDQGESQELWPTPPEWRWARISQVGGVTLGRPLNSLKRPKTKPTPYIRTANITLTGLDLSDVLKMDLTEYERENLRLIRGDILIADSSGSTSLVGRSAIWNEELPECCFQNHIIRFRPHALAPEFAHIIFQHMRSAGIFAQVSHGVGILHLGAARFAQLDVPVPSLEEQARIATETRERLESVSKAEAAMKSALRGIDAQVNALLEASTTGQLSEMIPPEPSSQERFPSTAVEQLARVGIPETWTWTRVDAVGEVGLGRQRSPKHEQGENLTPYLRVANVFEDQIDARDVLSMNFTPEERETYRLREGDILLNEGQSAELVGRPAVYRGEPPNVCFQNTLIRFRPSEVVRPEFALLVFRFYLRAGIFRAIARWSTNIAHLGLRRFAELPFPLPNLEVQDSMVALARAKLVQMEQQRVTILSSLSRSEKMRSEILAAAVSGELSSREEGDEKVDEMLARLGPPKETRPPRPKRAGGNPEEGEPAAEDMDLVEVLRDGGGRSPAEELFANAGFDRDLSTEVERFYLELREGLTGNVIKVAGTERGSSILEVTEK